MSRTVSDKMGIKEGVRAIFVNAPGTALEAIDPPSLDVASELVGEFDYIHLFARTRAELDDRFPKLKAHLGPKGTLWVSWPKNKKLGTDLAQDPERGRHMVSYQVRAPQEGQGVQQQLRATAVSVGGCKGG